MQLAHTQEGQAAIAAKIFTMGDRNNSGTITSDEITRAFAAIDADGDNLVSDSEYHGAWVHVRKYKFVDQNIIKLVFRIKNTKIKL